MSMLLFVNSTWQPVKKHLCERTDQPAHIQAVSGCLTSQAMIACTRATREGVEHYHPPASPEREQSASPLRLRWRKDNWYVL